MGFPIESDSRTPSDLRDVVAHAIAVVGGCGYVPLAPGTVGALAGALAFVAVAVGLEAAGFGAGASFVVHGVIVAAVTATGIWAAGRAERHFGRHDDGRIVIDEVAGQWVALLPLVGWAPGESGSFAFSGAVVTGFVLFRVFDVAKPGWIRWVERRFDGGWGVMADDLVAGVHAAVVLVPLLSLADAVGWTGAGA